MGSAEPKGDSSPVSPEGHNRKKGRKAMLIQLEDLIEILFFFALGQCAIAIVHYLLVREDQQKGDGEGKA